MKENLTQLLRSVPFVPFTLTLRNGYVYAVTTVERLSIGRNVCAYVDLEGLIILIPMRAIDQVAVSDIGELA
jgi:hypothetical protein